MKVQVIEAFSPSLGESYSVGDMIELDEETAKKLIAAGRVVPGRVKLYKNADPFKALSQKRVTQ